ncbi:FAD binding domain-containing protein [Mycena galericulata]|nr:FAD binding domain-containing protein [Mycena galericulata]
MSTNRTIVVGGGLAGLTAAHTLLERGKRVLLLDKKPGLGGNSVKASSGINGAYTTAQQALGIEDSVESLSELDAAGGTILHISANGASIARRAGRARTLQAPVDELVEEPFQALHASGKKFSLGSGAPGCPEYAIFF